MQRDKALMGGTQRLWVDSALMGGLSVNWGGLIRGDSALIGGGLIRGDIDLMRGPNFDRLYHKLKVLLLLRCNYFQICTITQHQYKRIGAINRIV